MSGNDRTPYTRAQLTRECASACHCRPGCPQRWTGGPELWPVRDPVWCPDCGTREVGEGLTVCVICEAEKNL